MRSDEANRFECINDSLTSSKYEFGNFHDTANWVECESKSYPNRTYFFNLRSLCCTWTRPVSRQINLQRYRKDRIYDQNFTYDINSQPIMIVSSESEDDRQSSITKSSPNFRRSKKEIFAWLYHGVDMHDRVDDDQTSCINSFVPNTVDVVRSEQELSANETAFYEIGYHFVANDDCEKIRISKAALEDVATNTLNFLEMNFSTSDNAIKIAEKDQQPKNNNYNDDSSIVEKCIAFSTPSFESCRSKEIVENYFAPRLQQITSKHLLKEKPQTKRRGIPQVKWIQKIPRKVVSEMKSTTTINCDPVKLDVPPVVKVTNLSDSSTSSSMWQKEHTTTSVPANIQFPDIVIAEVNLSSNASSSSSSTSCSSCSTSSDSSETTSDAVSKTSKEGET